MKGLVVRDVAVSFGGNRALSGVDLDAAPGVVTGLIGPNGAGKTTLFNVVCGLVVPGRGEVEVDGVDVTALKPFRRARIGLARTFQRLELFGLLTVRENVRLAAHLRGEGDVDARTDATLERCGVAALAEVRADRLPTGQARRVELARALARGPSVLLLDEPASGQDDEETRAFAELLREVAGDGITVVLVEHDMGLVMEVCAHIHVLDLGRVIASGTPEVVRADGAVLAAYLGSEGSAA